MRFELTRNDAGFILTVGVHARPRSTKLIRHLATGAIRASHQFARESGAQSLRIYGETLGDRAKLTVRVRTPTADPDVEIEVPRHTTTRRPPSRQFRSPSLSVEVDRIMNAAGLGSIPPPSRRPSFRPPAETPSPPVRRKRKDDDSDE